MKGNTRCQTFWDRAAHTPDLHLRNPFTWAHVCVHTRTHTQTTRTHTHMHSASAILTRTLTYTFTLPFLLTLWRGCIFFSLALKAMVRLKYRGTGRRKNWDHVRPQRERQPFCDFCASTRERGATASFLLKSPLLLSSICLVILFFFYNFWTTLHEGVTCFLILAPGSTSEGSVLIKCLKGTFRNSAAQYVISYNTKLFLG